MGPPRAGGCSARKSVSHREQLTRGSDPVRKMEARKGELWNGPAAWGAERALASCIWAVGHRGPTLRILLVVGYGERSVAILPLKRWLVGMGQAPRGTCDGNARV